MPSRADHEVEIEKDGVDTGLKAINPFSGEELPVWVGNYANDGVWYRCRYVGAGT